MSNPIDKWIYNRINGLLMDIISINKFKLLVRNLYRNVRYFIRDLKHRLFYGKYTGDILYITIPKDFPMDGKYHTLTASVDNVEAHPFETWKDKGTIFKCDARLSITNEQ